MILQPERMVRVEKPRQMQAKTNVVLTFVKRKKKKGGEGLFAFLPKKKFLNLAV